MVEKVVRCVCVLVPSTLYFNRFVSGAAAAEISLEAERPPTESHTHTTPHHVIVALCVHCTVQ